jgi:hypothetical protein
MRKGMKNLKTLLLLTLLSVFGYINAEKCYADEN